MASNDTTFVSQVTKITTAWAQAINDFVFKGRNPNYVASTGSANAYTVTLPAGTLYTSAGAAAGDAFAFKANFTNTASATLTIVGSTTLGPITLKFAGANLVGGEILSGAIAIVQYDGTSAQLLSSMTPASFKAASGKTLTVNDTATIATSTVTLGNGKILTLSDSATLATAALTLGNTKVLTLSDSTTLATNSITLGGGEVITFTAANALTLTTSGSTNVTLPTTGTLAITTQATDTFGALTDITTNNATTSLHGFCPKLGGGTTNYLRADGTWNMPTTGLALLASVTITAAATVDALTAFSASYDNVIIVLSGILPASDDTLLMRFANAGSADTGTNYYTGTGSFTTAASSIQISSSTVITAGKGLGAIIELQNVNDATNIKAGNFVYVGEQVNTPSFALADKAVAYIAANALSGVRFYWSGGSNFSAVGKIRIYGMQNS